MRLRSMLPSGPPPAANTTASQPSNAVANASASSLLDVEQPGLGAASPRSVGAVLLAADQRDRLVAGLDAARVELAGDLAVASDDGDRLMASTVRRAGQPVVSAAASRSSRSTGLVEVELLGQRGDQLGVGAGGRAAWCRAAEVDVAGHGHHLRRHGEVVGGGLDLAARAGAQVGVGVVGGRR